MMWGTKTPFKMTKLTPGNAGIGSGVGFEIDGVDVNVSALYDHSKVLQRPNGLEQWTIFFRETDALMFIMDMDGDTAGVKRDLEILLQPQNGLPSSIPVIVLACRLLGENEENAGANGEEKKPETRSRDFVGMAPAQIAQHLDLDTLNRPWFVQKVDVGAFSGIYTSFNWLFSYL